MATSHERAQWRRFATRHIRHPGLQRALIGATCLAFNARRVTIHIQGRFGAELTRAFMRALQDYFGCRPVAVVQEGSVDKPVGDALELGGIIALTPGRRRLLSG